MQFFQLNIGDRFRLAHAVKDVKKVYTKTRDRRVVAQHHEINNGQEFWLLANAADESGDLHSIDVPVEVVKL